MNTPCLSERRVNSQIVVNWTPYYLIQQSQAIAIQFKKSFKFIEYIIYFLFHFHTKKKSKNKTGMKIR